MVSLFLGQVCSAKLAAALLDGDPRWLRLLFPLAALAGGASLWLLGRIRWRGQGRGPRAEPGRRPGREALRILRGDRAFRTYEVGFMLYGFGFLWSVVLLTLYAEDRLGLRYGELTWAQFVAFPAGQILAGPFFGRLVDRFGIERATAASFLVLAAFFGLMPLVEDAPGLVAAYLLWGAAMAGVNVGWTLGPIHYAPDGKAHMYTAVHFSMEGIRSLFAPFLGWLVKSWFSFPVAFAMSAALVVLGAVVLWRLGRERVQA
jgi:predicted MFS family arabinose efflux permease